MAPTTATLKFELNVFKDVDILKYLPTDDSCWSYYSDQPTSSEKLLCAKQEEKRWQIKDIWSGRN